MNPSQRDSMRPGQSSYDTTAPRGIPGYQQPNDYYNHSSHAYDQSTFHAYGQPANGAQSTHRMSTSVPHHFGGGSGTQLPHSRSGEVFQERPHFHDQRGLRGSRSQSQQLMSAQDSEIYYQQTPAQNSQPPMVAGPEFSRTQRIFSQPQGFDAVESGWGMGGSDHDIGSYTSRRVLQPAIPDNESESKGTEAEAEDELRPDSVNSDAIDDRHDKAYEKVEESLWNYQKQTTALITMEVDEKSMMKSIGEHPSYHRGLTGEEAILRLKASGLNHCYLIRYSENRKGYVLTIYRKEKGAKDVEKHYNIVTENGRYKIHGRGFKDNFDNIGELLKHYEQNWIHPTLESIGKIYTQQDFLAQDEEEARVEQVNDREQPNPAQDPAGNPNRQAQGDGPPANEPAVNGPAGNGPAVNGPAVNGPAVNGPPVNGPPANGPAANGPAVNGPPANGPAVNGPPANGPAANGPPANGAHEEPVNREHANGAPARPQNLPPRQNRRCTLL